MCAKEYTIRRSPELSKPIFTIFDVSPFVTQTHSVITAGSSSILSLPPPSVLSISASDMDVTCEHAEASEARDAGCASF